MADTSIGRFLKRLFCSHAGAVDFVRNIHGDEIFEWGGKRSIWRCQDCGGLVLEGTTYPAFVQETQADHRRKPVDNSDLRALLHEATEAARSPDATVTKIRDAAPALLAALRQTWEVLDSAGLMPLSRGVELGPIVWHVKANDARRASMAAIADATGTRWQPGEARPPSRTVESLQRELLAVARGGRFAETWREINGLSEVPNLRAEMGKLARVNELRAQIRAINPDAALYYGWAGPGDRFDPVTARREAASAETFRLFGPKGEI